METHNEVIRHLAKYVFIDVVKFSTRSAEAQSDIVKSFNKIVYEVLEKHHVNKDNDNECILIPTGDGMCISLLRHDLPFDSHVQIALGILELIHNYNADETLQDSRRYQVRIGINQNTDILVTDINGRKNVAGAGINMAARVMDKADGGQILVSQAVHHELHPSEIYMDKFERFNATGKNNITFTVYQYINKDFLGLNVETPSAWVKTEIKTVEKKLPEKTAHYFVQAIIHKEDILRIKTDKGQLYWDDVTILLLYFLALDSYNLSKTSEFDDPPRLYTVGTGKMSFEEQYSFYESQQYKVRDLAVRLITINSPVHEGLELSNFDSCFEGSNYDRHYEFINAEGKEKLKKEWLNIWIEYDLDQYV